MILAWNSTQYSAVLAFTILPIFLSSSTFFPEHFLFIHLEIFSRDLLSAWVLCFTFKSLYDFNIFFCLYFKIHFIFSTFNLISLQNFLLNVYNDLFCQCNHNCFFIDLHLCGVIPIKKSISNPFSSSLYSGHNGKHRNLLWRGGGGVSP